jgi:hypothetical protein
MDGRYPYIVYDDGSEYLSELKNLIVKHNELLEQAIKAPDKHEVMQFLTNVYKYSFVIIGICVIGETISKMYMRNQKDAKE